MVGLPLQSSPDPCNYGYCLPIALMAINSITTTYASAYLCLLLPIDEHALSNQMEVIWKEGVQWGKVVGTL